MVLPSHTPVIFSNTLKSPGFNDITLVVVDEEDVATVPGVHN